MLKGQKENYVGLAGLYSPEQLRSYFLNYIYFIIGVELFIFLVSFMSNLGPEKGPFPWKFYFYIAFMVPIAITFLLGLFIIAFNRYIFGMHSSVEDTGHLNGEEGDTKNKFLKFNTLILSLRHIPFVPTLFLLVIGSVLVYKMDDIFLFIFKAGEKVLYYIAIAAAVLLGAAFIFGLIWVISNYLLSKKHMEQEYEYRKDVMKNMGFLILDDNMVIDKEGRVIMRHPAQPLLEGESQIMDNVKILPAPVNQRERVQ
jgi:hypothetical protein